MEGGITLEVETEEFDTKELDTAVDVGMEVGGDTERVAGVVLIDGSIFEVDIIGMDSNIEIAEEDISIAKL